MLRRRKVRLESLPTLDTTASSAEPTDDGLAVDLAADLAADTGAGGSGPQAPPARTDALDEVGDSGEGGDSGNSGDGAGFDDRPGGRAPRRRPGGLRPLLAAGVAAIVLTVIATLIQQPTPAITEGATAIEPVGSAVLLCPEPGAASDLGVRVTAAVVPGQPGQDEDGTAGLRTLPGRQSAQSRIEVPGGQAQIEAFGTRLPAIEAYGAGGLAPGLVADQWGRDPGGQGRGMASTACAPASSESWFVGGGAIAGRQTRIVLVNPDETAAVVDVIIRGPEGVIDAPAGRGLVVKGQDRLVLRLDVLAPGVSATAVQVLARTGRVGASVDDEQRSGLANIGTDWVPQAALPSRRVYVPGIVNGAGARVLSVSAPGADDAIVDVRVISADGTYAPAERARIEVPADSVVALDMAPILDKRPATLELTSDVPIVAGMRMFFGNETAFTAGALPFDGPAAVSGLPVRPATDVRVSLTAPEGDAAVDISLLPFRGGKDAAEPTPPRRIQIAAGTIRYIRLNAPSGVDWYTAVVTPADGSGPILVAHRLRERSRFGDLVTGYPWRPLRTEVEVPTAVPEPSVALR
jgi:hypothetical protein